MYHEPCPYCGKEFETHSAFYTNARHCDKKPIDAPHRHFWLVKENTFRTFHICECGEIKK